MIPCNKTTFPGEFPKEGRFFAPLMFSGYFTYIYQFRKIID